MRGSPDFRELEDGNMRLDVRRLQHGRLGALP